MSKTIMIGCDLHDRSMLLRYAVDSAEPQQLACDNDARGRRRMIARLKSIAQKNDARRIVFAYEASGLGHGLSDQLDGEGIECYVLSPTHLPKTPKSAKQKTDARDAQMLLEQLRGFVLAGNSLPVVWTPPQRLRDDRELVRARIDVADELTRVKLKITTLFKAREIKIASPTKTRWTKAFVRWIREDVIPTLDLTVATKLKLLLDRFELYRREQGELDKALKKLSGEKRYKVVCAELRKLPGVGLLVAMSFLTEMGDLNRFSNRRQIAAYLGLCPSSNESGQKNDRKGRITRQGPARLRKVLCQAAWVSVNKCDQSAETYHRIRQNQKHRTKKALVALMRKLGIRMWHIGLSCGVSSELVGRERPCSSSGRTSLGTPQRDAVATIASPSHQPLGCAG
jgi:transposase